MIKRGLISLFGLIALIFMVTACSSSVAPSSAQGCELLKQRYYLAQQLRSKNIQVIQVGDETTLVLPADTFFYSHSNHLRENAAAADLPTVINFINAYPAENIQVTGYTDNVGDYTRNLALSRAQAEAIIHYLWQHGLHTRLISAAGRACHNDIASNMTAYGRSQNRRIEIYFRLPPPNNVFH